MPVCGRFRKGSQAGLYRITGSPDNRIFTKSRKEGPPPLCGFSLFYRHCRKSVRRHSYRFWLLNDAALFFVRRPFRLWQRQDRRLASCPETYCTVQICCRSLLLGGTLRLKKSLLNSSIVFRCLISFLPILLRRHISLRQDILAISASSFFGNIPTNLWKMLSAERYRDKTNTM